MALPGEKHAPRVVVVPESSSAAFRALLVS
jgi:hypothetical protein